MAQLMAIVNHFKMGLSDAKVPETVLLVVVVMSVLLGLYEFFVYRTVSHKGYYNRSFNITLTVIPLFLSTIVLILQSSLSVTLGAIGVLAIARFRTAIKEPVDMIYLLWSIHTGITCGCQLYEVSIVTSVVATLMIVFLNYVSLLKAPLVLIVHVQPGENVKSIEDIIGNVAKNFRMKSCNHTTEGEDIVFEVQKTTKQALSDELNRCNVAQYTIIEYDSEDML